MIQSIAGREASIPGIRRSPPALPYSSRPFSDANSGTRAALNDLDGRPSTLQEAPGDQTTGETEEGLVDIGTLLVPDTKSAKLVEPREGSFDNPAPFPQSTAVLCISLCQEGSDATPAQTVADLLGIVSTIAYKAVGTAAWTSTLGLQRRNGIDK